MLQGIVLYPGEPLDLFIASLNAVRHVRWVSVVITGKGKRLEDPDELIPPHTNLAVILDSGFTDFGYLSGLVRKGCHLFLTEKQKLTFAERLKLFELAEEGNTFIQIRNDLLFHPLLSHSGKKRSESKLIEIHHIVPGKPGTIQEVIYNNLLIISKIIESEPSRISVCSIPNSACLPEVVNLHLDFHNGSAASLTISFTGEKKEHLLSVHSADGVMSYSFKENESFQPTAKQQPEGVPIFSNDLLIKQIGAFADNILRRNCKNLSASEEAGIFLLMEKINRKLELGSVLI